VRWNTEKYFELYSPVPNTLYVSKLMTMGRHMMPSVAGKFRQISRPVAAH
jgi:hypothetical protein